MEMPSLSTSERNTADAFEYSYCPSSFFESG